jgi:succinate-semialdehyde dehydrogenase / glutarate-semialdehyde dehydrogenase
MTSTYAVVDPATGETLREFPTLGDDGLRAALDRADAAWRGPLKDLGVDGRAELIRRVGDLHAERREQLAAIIGREMGKPVTQALREVDFAATIYRYYAEVAAEIMADEEIKVVGKGTAIVRRSALGALLGIMPWNYPYYQVARFAAPNLIVGNSIVLKHAPQCPESAEAIASIYVDAGRPEGGYENVFATHDQIEWVIADPRVRGVSVTGSERAGGAVAEIAGRNLKKVVLELGGSDPFIALSAADLDELVADAVGARLTNAGQACNSAKRFIVLDDLYDGFLERFTETMKSKSTGVPSSPDTAVGPLSSALAAERLEDQVKRAVEAGATLVTGGKRDGNFFEPTVLTDIAPDNPAAMEEFFGPVAQVYRVGSEEEAIELANATEFGLGSYLMTDDAEQAERVADQLEAGMVYINTIAGGGAELPFGGVKRSGFGRELGHFGADEFVNKKLIRRGRED